jgi:long-subunit acyl-CoA synthetase (AMP-forming)
MQAQKKLSPAAPSVSFPSLVELLYQPISADDKKNETLFIEPRGNLVRKFDREDITYFVTQFARGMNATNTKRGSKIGFICKTSVKAIIATLGNLLNGLVNVIIPEEASLQERLTALSTSRAETLVVDTIESVLPILQNIKNLPQLRQIIVLSESDFQKQPEILCVGWKELMERGESQPDKTEIARKSLTLDTEAFLYFQYDNKHLLKGLLQTHGQMLTQMDTLLEETPFLTAADPTRQRRMLSLAPFHHPHSYITTVMLPLLTGQNCMILDRSESWKIESLASRKTYLITEASYFETMVEKLDQSFAEQGGFFEKVWNNALGLGEKIELTPAAATSMGGKIRASVVRSLLLSALSEFTGGVLETAVAIDRDPNATTRALLAGIGTHFVAMPTTHQGLLEMPQVAEASEPHEPFLVPSLAE